MKDLLRTGAARYRGGSNAFDRPRPLLHRLRHRVTEAHPSSMAHTVLHFVGRPRQLRTSMLYITIEMILILTLRERDTGRARLQ